MTIDEPTRIAWARFVNRLKIDGRQHGLILRLVYDLRVQARKAEQQVYNARRALELERSERERFYVKA